MSRSITHITSARTNPGESPPGLEAIASLDREGVQVAAGNGTRWQRALVNTTLTGGLVLAAVNSRNEPLFLMMLPPILLAIDFLSGFVHWFFDTQVQPSDSFLGRIAVDFLDHHVRPGRTAEVGFYASAWRPALYVSLPLIALSTLPPLSTHWAATIFWVGFLSMLVPQTHKLTHMPVQFWAVTAMQTTRLIIHPASHQAHHDNNDESFCVFTGWLNPVLDKSRFWRGLEWLFARARKL